MGGVMFLEGQRMEVVDVTTSAVRRRRSGEYLHPVFREVKSILEHELKGYRDNIGKTA